MDELIDNYGLNDAAAMLLAAFRIRRLPADVAAWFTSAEPAERSFEQKVLLAARRRRRHRWRTASYDNWGCLVVAGERVPGEAVPS